MCIVYQEFYIACIIATLTYASQPALCHYRNFTLVHSMSNISRVSGLMVTRLLVHMTPLTVSVHILEFRPRWGLLFLGTVYSLATVSMLMVQHNHYPGHCYLFGVPTCVIMYGKYSGANSSCILGHRASRDPDVVMTYCIQGIFYSAIAAVRHCRVALPEPCFPCAMSIIVL